MAENDKLYVQVARENIASITRIFEGYEYLAQVSTVDSEQGIVVLRATADTLPEVRLVVENLPFAAYVRNEE